MSIGTAQGEPLTSADTFDQDWAAARSGTLAGPERQPAAGDGTPEPTSPAPPVAAEPGQPSAPPASPPVAVQAATPAPPPTPVPFTLAPEVVQQFPAEMRTPEAIARAARSFLSVQGQLPNLEQRWREQHVAPLQQELTALREERRQALDQLVRVDPNTGQQRTPQDQAYIRSQIAQAEAQQTEAQRRQQEQAEVQQARQIVQQQQAQVQDQGQAAMKLVAINSLPSYKQRLAETYGVPLAELDQYTTMHDYSGRVQGLGDLSHFGGMITALEDYAKIRQTQIAQQNAAVANAAGRYRDTGAAGAGTGGQAAGDRWAKANREDFESAWKRAIRGELV